MKLEGWSLYGLVPYRSLFELYFQSVPFTLRSMHDPTLLCDLDLYDKLHMSILLLHVKGLGLMVMLRTSCNIFATFEG